MSSLAQLVEDGAFREAHDRLLALWHRKPYARLAALLTELGTNAGASATRQALETIFDTSNSVAALERLGLVFATLPSDPCVFDWMVEELGHPRFDLSSGNPRRLYAGIVAEMAKLSDERIAPWLAKLPEFLEAHKGRRHGQLSPEEIQALRKIFASCTFTPPLLERLTDEEEAELTAVREPLARLATSTTARDDQRARLFAQVCADFDDDVAKEVFADFLLEEDNPLGEYILLGLKLAREGELSPALDGRQRGLLEHARSFQPMGSRFARGFAVEARFTDGEGIRRGSYGLEPGWGTIAISDVPPTSDACHTQSLRELDLGSSFIADLAKLKKPLGVTKLKWRTPSQAGRARWKKIKVLPELHELTLQHPIDGTFEWVLTEGPGPGVRELFLDNHARWAGHFSWICERLASAGALVSVRVGPHIVFTRKGSGVELTLHVPDATVLAKLTTELANVARPSVDAVVVEGPGDGTTYAALLTLGRTSRTTLARSAAADAARVTRDGDTLTIDPAPEQAVFDVPALRSLLGRTGTRRVVIASSAVIEETGAYLRVVEEAGGSEIALAIGPPRWGRGRFALTATPAGLDVDLAAANQVTLVLGALASLAAPAKKLVVRHPPALRSADLERVAAALRGVVADVEIVPEERVHAALFRYANVKGRVEIDPAGTALLLTPSVADLILAGKPRPKELRVGHLDFALAPWIAWVTRTKVAVTFARDWRVAIMNKLSWDEGVVARLWVDGAWLELVESLADIPDGAFKHLDLRSSIAPTAEAKDACKRVALTYKVVS